MAHKPSATQFVLVVTTRVGNGETTYSLSLRAVDHLVLVGQQQPVSQAHEVPTVPRPSSREFKELLYRRISFAVQQASPATPTLMLMLSARPCPLTTSL